jgi:hypothetical protein
MEALADGEAADGGAADGEAADAEAADSEAADAELELMEISRQNLEFIPSETANSLLSAFVDQDETRLVGILTTDPDTAALLSQPLIGAKSVLHVAAENCVPLSLVSLVTKTDLMGSAPQMLRAAVRNNQLDLVKYLVHAGAVMPEDDQSGCLQTALAICKAAPGTVPEQVVVDTQQAVTATGEGKSRISVRVNKACGRWCSPQSNAEGETGSSRNGKTGACSARSCHNHCTNSDFAAVRPGDSQGRALHTGKLTEYLALFGICEYNRVQDSQ